MAIRYEPNIRSMGMYLKTDRSLKRVLRDVADDVEEIATAIAPIDTGAYVSSIQVVDADLLDRQGMLVEATDAAAAPLEFGNRQTGGRGRNLLTRAAEIAGLDVAE
jgi:hypothetical protein